VATQLQLRNISYIFMGKPAGINQIGSVENEYEKQS
jgi:hypothetical protein